MIKPILFRGGMYGDIILGMLDPSALITTNRWQKEYVHSTCAGKYIKYTRTYLKKFHKYTNEQKIRYYKTFDKVGRDVYFLTHDTDFSQHHKEKTMQLICSDRSLMKHFAERFEKLHRTIVIDEAKQFIEQKASFVKDYEESLNVWQEAFVFPQRFDIKNIFNKKQFLHDLDQCFTGVDLTHAGELYDHHLQRI